MMKIRNIVKEDLVSDWLCKGGRKKDSKVFWLGEQGH